MVLQGTRRRSSGPSLQKDAIDVGRCDRIQNIPVMHLVLRLDGEMAVSLRQGKLVVYRSHRTLSISQDREDDILFEHSVIVIIYTGDEMGPER